MYRRIRAELRKPNVCVTYSLHDREGDQASAFTSGSKRNDTIGCSPCGGKSVPKKQEHAGEQQYVPGGMVESVFRNAFASSCESANTLAFVVEASMECIGNTPIGLGTEMHALVSHALVVAARIIEAQRRRIASIFKASALRAEFVDRNNMSPVAFAECFRVICGTSPHFMKRKGESRGQNDTMLVNTFLQFIDGVSSRATCLQEGTENHEEQLERFAGEVLGNLALAMDLQDDNCERWTFARMSFVDRGLFL